MPVISGHEFFILLIFNFTKHYFTHSFGYYRLPFDATTPQGYFWEIIISMVYIETYYTVNGPVLMLFGDFCPFFPFPTLVFYCFVRFFKVFKFFKNFNFLKISVSICLHNQAFYQMFSHSVREMDNFHDERKELAHLAYLVKFHMTTKK